MPIWIMISFSTKSMCETYVGIIGGGNPPPPARPGGGGALPGAPGAALETGGGCRATGGGFLRGPAPGEGGACDTLPPPPPALGAGIQSDLMGGGAGVLTVAIDTSPMILSASLQAWYWRSISSRLMASSALSSIMDCYRTETFEF